MASYPKPDYFIILLYPDCTIVFRNPDRINWLCGMDSLEMEAWVFGAFAKPRIRFFSLFLDCLGQACKLLSKAPGRMRDHKVSRSNGLVFPCLCS